MKHAGSAALDALEPLLAHLRALPGLAEKSRGVFYSKSKAFLHFHEDPKGLFADIRAEDGRTFDRFDVTGPEGQARLRAIAEDRLRSR
ncbi:MAG: hypothetical protein ACK41C_14775 [Phenylobacterium sp.]|uniref:hypothetical protein n=1 Tax=Phenylobacterium sp. TaxID=1871053 RepID=UPI003918EFE9